MTKDTKITHLTKNNLIDAFWIVCKKETLKKVTIKKITEIAGYNRSTFYEYFLDLPDLLDHIEDQLIENVMEQMSFIIVNQKEKPLELIAMLENYGEYLYILLGPNGDSSFTWKFKRALEPLMKEICKDLTDPLAYLFLCEYSVSIISTITSYWIRNKENLNTETFILRFDTLMKNGMNSILIS